MGLRNLYDEARVRALSPGGELVLGPGDLATPAALDLAFAKGIRVRRAGDAGEHAAAAAGAKDALWRALLAQDGTYVVLVRGGRARVHRLTESGPVPVEAS